MELDGSLGIAVFTDGSASHRDRTGGWGWVALDAFEGAHTASGSDTDTTISQMELKAPREALYTLHRYLGPLEVLIYSDSEYVVLGCQDKTRKRRKNIGFWDSLDWAINLHTYVTFEHVKGHSGSVYNEMADELAGQARKSQ